MIQGGPCERFDVVHQGLECRSGFSFHPVQIARAMLAYSLRTSLGLGQARPGASPVVPMPAHGCAH
jgi:hypothetical protein